MREPTEPAVVATGLTPSLPNIGGAEASIPADNVLTGHVAVSEDAEVVTLGGDELGCETALHLIENGHVVVVLAMEDDIAMDAESIYISLSFARLSEVPFNGNVAPMMLITDFRSDDIKR